MCIYFTDPSLLVFPATASPPWLHIQPSPPPAAGESTDQILGDLHFAYRTREEISYNNKNGPKFCERQYSEKQVLLRMKRIKT